MYYFKLDLKHTHIKFLFVTASHLRHGEPLSHLYTNIKIYRNFQLLVRKVTCVFDVS